jgi:L-iditol 2-dehydrogenase
MPETMRALMLVKERKLAVVEQPRPEPAPGDAVVRVHCVGVCGSDLHGYTGHTGRRIPPLVMGHEAAGEIVALGARVADWSVGDRVAVQTTAACGACNRCRAGAENDCERRRIMGMTDPGAYAEYVAWPASSLVPLPEGLSYLVASLAEPLGVAIHAADHASLEGRSVFIAGAGPIGLLTVVAARARGAGMIIVSDLDAARLEVAGTVGADHALHAGERDPAAAVRELTGGSGVDVSFEAVGATEPVRQTLDATRNGGVVVWIGNNADRIELSMQAVVTRSLTIRGAYGVSREDLEEAVRLLAGGQVPVEALVNRHATLDEGPSLFEELLATPATIKCVLEPLRIAASA